MPIDDQPFLQCGWRKRPAALARLINPYTGHSFNTVGMIDTGTDGLVVPTSVAAFLGYPTQTVGTHLINTGNGIVEASSGLITVELYHSRNKIFPVFSKRNVKVKFLPNLSHVLFGMCAFGLDFILTIDFHKKIFSAKYT